jgi:hypothetical protein
VFLVQAFRSDPASAGRKEHPKDKETRHQASTFPMIGIIQAEFFFADDFEPDRDCSSLVSRISPSLG